MPKSNRATSESGTFFEENLRWIEEIDTCLVDSMLEKHVKGSFIDGQLSLIGYNRVLTL